MRYRDLEEATYNRDARRGTFRHYHNAARGSRLKTDQQQRHHESECIFDFSAGYTGAFVTGVLGQFIL